MADVTGSGFNGDATGGIGQALAYVLPEGKIGGYAMQLAQQHGELLRENAKKLYLQKQQEDAQYKDDLMKQKLPEIYAPFDKVIRDRQEKWINDAASYRASTGKNPFNDPDFINNHSKDILGPASKSTQFGALVMEQMKEVDKDKEGKYSEQSKKQWLDWYDKFNAASDSEKIDYLDNPDKHKMPTLQPKDPDYMSKALKELGEPYEERNDGFIDTKKPDVRKIELGAFQLLGNPEYDKYFLNKGVKLDAPIPAVYDFKHDSKGNRITGTQKVRFPTSPEEVTTIADSWLSNPMNNNKVKQALGIQNDPNADEIIKNDPHVKDRLIDFIEYQNTAISKALHPIVESKINSMGEKQKKEYEGLNYGLRLKEFNLKKDKEQAQAEQPTETEIPYHTAGSEDGTTGAFNIKVHNFVPISQTGVNFTGSADVDLHNGKIVSKDKSAIKGDISGVGDFPIANKDLKNGDETIKKGTPVNDKIVNNREYKRMVVINSNEGTDKDGNKITRQYLIDYNKLPSNVKNSKAMKEALAKFNKTPVYNDKDNDPLGLGL